MLDFSDSKSSIQSIFIIFLMFCIVVAIVIELIKWFYLTQASGYLFKDTKSTFDSETYDQTNPHLMVTSRNENQGQEYSYSFWMIIRKNVDEGDTKERVVMSRGIPSVSRGNPVVFLGGESGTLQNMTIRVRTYPHQKASITGTGDEVSHLECVVNDIPLRRWVHVAVCGRNNALDVFVNGRLAQHAESKQPLQSSSGPLHINQNGGFDGFISKLHYANYYYTYDQIYTMIKSGPAPIPDLNKQYGTDNVGVATGGGLPNKWWTQQRASSE